MPNIFTTAKDEQINVVFTPAVVQQVKDLPLVASTKGQLSFVSVFYRLSPRARRSFFAAMDMDDALRDIYDLAKFHFATVAHPDTGRWPVFERTDIVEEFHVDCLPVVSVFATVDGRRYCVAAGRNNQTRVLSYLEFEHQHGISVFEHLKRTAQLRIRRLKRAITLSRNKNPMLFRAQCVDEAMQVLTKDVVAYSAEGVKDYFRTNHLDVLGMEALPVEFKEGQYRERE